MTNQEKINEHIVKHTDSLGEVFGYQDVYEVADEILNATITGKYYATLKFLQQYCTPINVAESSVSGFRSGDPRQYKELNNVKNDWEFVLHGRVEVGFSVTKSQKEYKPGISISLKTEQSMELTKFPDYYQQYSWNGKHKLFGYPSDSYPNFPWIASLEKRFNWLCENSAKQKTASQYLIKEMIEWGGSQNGVLQKFNDGCGEVNLYEALGHVIDSLSDPKQAITCALRMPGLGLTYASKLLRFMKPERYGALDRRIRKALAREGKLPQISDSHHSSMISGYVKFVALLQELKAELETNGIKKPVCQLSEGISWRASDVEMALFCWAEESSR